MNNNQIKGKLDQAKGAVQREVGKLTGDTGTQLKGTFNKAKGEVRETIGNKQEENKNQDKDA